MYELRSGAFDLSDSFFSFYLALSPPYFKLPFSLFLLRSANCEVLRLGDPELVKAVRPKIPHARRAERVPKHLFVVDRKRPAQITSKSFS